MKRTQSSAPQQTGGRPRQSKRARKTTGAPPVFTACLPHDIAEQLRGGGGLPPNATPTAMKLEVATRSHSGERRSAAAVPTPTATAVKLEAATRTRCPERSSIAAASTPLASMASAAEVNGVGEDPRQQQLAAARHPNRRHARKSVPTRVSVTSPTSTPTHPMSSGEARGGGRHDCVSTPGFGASASAAKTPGNRCTGNRSSDLAGHNGGLSSSESSSKANMNTKAKANMNTEAKMKLAVTKVRTARKTVPTQVFAIVTVEPPCSPPSSSSSLPAAGLASPSSSSSPPSPLNDTTSQAETHSLIPVASGDSSTRSKRLQMGTEPLVSSSSSTDIAAVPNSPRSTPSSPSDATHFTSCSSSSSVVSQEASSTTSASSSSSISCSSRKQPRSRSCGMPAANGVGRAGELGLTKSDNMRRNGQGRCPPAHRGGAQSTRKRPRDSSVDSSDEVTTGSGGRPRELFPSFQASAETLSASSGDTRSTKVRKRVVQRDNHGPGAGDIAEGRTLSTHEVTTGAGDRKLPSPESSVAFSMVTASPASSAGSCRMSRHARKSVGAGNNCFNSLHGGPEKSKPRGARKSVIKKLPRDLPPATSTPSRVACATSSGNSVKQRQARKSVRKAIALKPPPIAEPLSVTKPPNVTKSSNAMAPSTAANPPPATAGEASVAPPEVASDVASREPSPTLGVGGARCASGDKGCQSGCRSGLSLSRDGAAESFPAATLAADRGASALNRDHSDTRLSSSTHSTEPKTGGVHDAVSQSSAELGNSRTALVDTNSRKARKSVARTFASGHTCREGGGGPFSNVKAESPTGGGGGASSPVPAAVKRTHARKSTGADRKFLPPQRHNGSKGAGGGALDPAPPGGKLSVPSSSRRRVNSAAVEIVSRVYHKRTSIRKSTGPRHDETPGGTIPAAADGNASVVDGDGELSRKQRLAAERAVLIRSLRQWVSRKKYPEYHAVLDAMEAEETVQGRRELMARLRDLQSSVWSGVGGKRNNRHACDTAAPPAPKVAATEAVSTPAPQGTRARKSTTQGSPTTSFRARIGGSHPPPANSAEATSRSRTQSGDHTEAAAAAADHASSSSSSPSSGASSKSTATAKAASPHCSSSSSNSAGGLRNGERRLNAVRTSRLRELEGIEQQRRTPPPRAPRARNALSAGVKFANDGDRRDGFRKLCKAGVLSKRLYKGADMQERLSPAWKLITKHIYHESSRVITPSVFPQETEADSRPCGCGEEPAAAVGNGDQQRQQPASRRSKPLTCGRNSLCDCAMWALHASEEHARPGRYDRKGRLADTHALVVSECNSQCGCPPTCSRRVLQRSDIGKSIRVALEWFDDKGWGLVTRRFIPVGTYICEYVGEILDEKEATTRGELYDQQGLSFLWTQEARIPRLDYTDDTPPVEVTIDATRYGNVSRFVNHSCDPNMRSVHVLVEQRCALPRIGFFASRDIAVGEELTINYFYIIDESSKDGEIPCRCGARNCSGRLR